MFFSTHYFNLKIGEITSFYANDTWCFNNFNLAGKHCFGDFGKAMILVSQDMNVWQGNVLTTPYPAANYILYSIFLKTNIFLPVNLIYIFNQILVISCVVVPLLHYSQKFKNNNTSRIDILLIAFCNLPLMIAFDRGTSAVFPLIFVYLFFHKFMKGNMNQSIFWLTIAVSLRPQFIVFSIIFLFVSRINFIKSAASNIFIFLISFALYGGKEGLGYFLSWINQLNLYSKIIIIDMWPPNYNPGLGFIKITDLFFSFSSINFKFIVYGFIVLFFITSITAIMLAEKKVSELWKITFIYLSILTTFLPIYAYGYYASYLLLPLFIIMFENINIHKLGLGNKFLGIFLICNLCISISPLIIPVLIDNNNLVQFLIPICWSLFMFLVIFRSLLNLFLLGREKLRSSINSN